MTKNTKRFLIYLLLIPVLNLSASLIACTKALELPLSVLATIFAIGLPILALFTGADQKWTFNRGLVFLFGGVIIQFGLVALSQTAFSFSVPLILACRSLSQVGLVLWCLGFGATVSLLIQDKNLILPITIFLAILDILFVLTPVGITQAVMKAAPQVLPSVAYSVPKVHSEPTTGKLFSLAFVGPADFLFIAMFFAALHRFGMEVKKTLIVLIPTLVLYLLAVIFLGHLAIGRLSLSALPALVPIGTVVLLTNLRSFKLNRDEKLSTLLVLGIAVGVLIWGATRPPKPQRPEGPKGPHQEITMNQLRYRAAA